MREQDETWENMTRKKMTRRDNWNESWKQKQVVIREHARGGQHQRSMIISKYRGKKELKNRVEKGLE